MFTLPINRDSTVNLSVPGKKSKDRTWKLTTVVQSGITINFGDWIPGDKTNYNVPSIFTLEILIDGVISSTHIVTPARQTFIDNFVDTDQLTDRTITFKIRGKDTDQLVVDEIHSAVCLYFYIEDLSFEDQIYKLCQYRVLLTDTVQPGSSIIGQNGELTLQLTTPIYTWLLSNPELI